jgi:hypothetical protein
MGAILLEAYTHPQQSRTTSSLVLLRLLRRRRWCSAMAEAKQYMKPSCREHTLFFERKVVRQMAAFVVATNQKERFGIDNLVGPKQQHDLD